MVAAAASVALATVGLVLVGATTPAHASNAVLTPTSFTREAGVVSGGVAELQSIDASAVQLGPGATRSYRNYQLPAGTSASSIWSFTVKAHYIGPTRTQQSFNWYIRNFTTNKWILIGDNYEAQTQNAPGATP